VLQSLIVLFTPGSQGEIEMEPTAPFSLLNSFWQTQLQIIEESDLDFKNFALPLARIKKVMKVDDDVKPMVYQVYKQTILFFLDDFC
jgi:hypothetical protein